ncbi:retropepsin-like aspartic protease family protein [Marinobacterium aestuariivivens]|uniref:TIGR02281 family clan AA aspartic protease n=1 Tax=Marinobacterium aestuariivivens TaxID=1698799 RepID=A0ABW1ZSW1_9GAMM
MTDFDAKSRNGGRLMWFAAWLSLLALLVLGFDGWLERQYNPNSELRALSVDGKAEVVLQRNRAGHYVAPGLINGQPVQFLVDTGATRISVPEPLAQRLGLRAGFATRVTTANGMATVYDTQLDEVRLGAILIRNVPGNINPGMPGDMVLLGMSFMKDLELVQRGETLTLRLH